MSKLKAKHVVDVYDAYSSNPYNESLVYLKSEADEVIAEKDKVITELQKQVHDYSQGLYVMQAMAENEARHHKYKRCLAMARIAQDDWHLHNAFYAMGHQEFEKRKCEFYEKWRKRWIAIAEKFKEEK